MKFFCIEGVELNPDRTLADKHAMYFTEGVFVGANVHQKVEAAILPFDCSDYENKSRINVYYNPDTRKYTLSAENIDTPCGTVGYHLGGITLQKGKECDCMKRLLLPYNEGVIYYRTYNTDYNKAFEDINNLEPQTLFTDRFTDGYKQNAIPEVIPPGQNCPE